MSTSIFARPQQDLPPANARPRAEREWVKIFKELPSIWLEPPINGVLFWLLVIVSPAQVTRLVILGISHLEYLRMIHGVEGRDADEGLHWLALALCICLCLWLARGNTHPFWNLLPANFSAACGSHTLKARRARRPKAHRLSHDSIQNRKRLHLSK